VALEQAQFEVKPAPPDPPHDAALLFSDAAGRYRAWQTKRSSGPGNMPRRGIGSRSIRFREGTGRFRFVPGK